MPFEFATATRIIFGAGKLLRAGRLAKEFGTRALIVTGRDTRRAEPLRSLLSEQGVSAVTFPIPGEPELAHVRQGAALAKHEKCDLVISFGGGSALDAGQALPGMMTNPADLADYLQIIRRSHALARPSAPLFRLSPTPGTRSVGTLE